MEQPLFGQFDDEELHKAVAPPPPWDDGEYPYVVSATARYAAENGKEYGGIKATLQFVRESDGKTKMINKYLSFSPKARELNAQFLMSTGLHPNEFTDESQLAGLQGRARLVTKATPAGHKRNEANFFVPADRFRNGSR